MCKICATVVFAVERLRSDTSKLNYTSLLFHPFIVSASSMPEQSAANCIMFMPTAKDKLLRVLHGYTHQSGYTTTNNFTRSISRHTSGPMGKKMSRAMTLLILCCLGLGKNIKKPQQKHFYCGFVVVPPGIEPGTQGFSVLCSTN